MERGVVLSKTLGADKEQEAVSAEDRQAAVMSGSL